MYNKRVESKRLYSKWVNTYTNIQYMHNCISMWDIVGMPFFRVFTDIFGAFIISDLRSCISEYDVFLRDYLVAST